eukprot:3785804-Rhodomonas_salina.1
MVEFLVGLSLDFLTNELLYHFDMEQPESADRSILEVFPENVDCSVCLNTTPRDQLSNRVCVSESESATTDVFACVKEHPICYTCAEEMRTRRQNRCPFCRQTN